MSVDDNCHVLHIASGDLWAGAEVQLATLAITTHRLQRSRVSVILLNHGRLEQELLAGGIDVTVLDESSLSALAILRGMIDVLRDKDIDIVHTHRMKENILGSLACLVAGGLPSLRTVHGASEHSAPWYRPRGMLMKLDRFIGGHLQRAVIAVTLELADKLDGDFPSSKLRVIHNGIDTRIADNIETTDDERIHVGIVGRLTPVKRVDLFLQTAAILSRDERYRFHVYGDGPLLPELKALNRSLGLGDRVTFHGHSDDIHRAIARLDVLMMPSDHEGLPMTLLEAMCLGTAVVAHQVDGLPQVLDHGRCGSLVAGQIPDAYAEAVRQVVKDDAMRASMIESARERVASEYSAEANAEAIHLLYQDILSRR